MLKKFFAATLFFVLGITAVFGYQQQNQTSSLFNLEALAQLQSFRVGFMDSPFSIAVANLPRSKSLVSGDVNFEFPFINYFHVANHGNIPFIMPTQMDINGDGLSDFVYSVVAVPYAVNEQYILLNSSNGYELAYYCSITPDSGGSIYLGHCADPNNPL
jgi:hypothetical protein